MTAAAVEIVWIYRGPEAGSYRQMSPAAAFDAVQDGWGQIVRDQDGALMKPPVRDEHPAAVAFIKGEPRPGKTRLVTPEDPAPALNRQMEAEKPATYKTKATGKKKPKRFSGG
jgi:hypothetical protein